MRQRGWTACLAATLVFVFQWLYLGAIAIHLKYFMEVKFTDPQIYRCLVNWSMNFRFFDPGLTILSVWITQHFLQRQPGEVDWVDRFGRLLGWSCLLFSGTHFLFETASRLSRYGLI